MARTDLGLHVCALIIHDEGVVLVVPKYIIPIVLATHLSSSAEEEHTRPHQETTTTFVKATSVVQVKQALLGVSPSFSKSTTRTAVLL